MSFVPGSHFYRQKTKYTKPAAKLVPTTTGLPIRDCARGCTNRGQWRPMMSAIDVTAKTLFERLYLVLGTFGPRVNCPYAPTTPTVHSTTISRFLCSFFARMASHFCGHHDSPSNLAKSRYPPGALHFPTQGPRVVSRGNFFDFLVRELPFQRNSLQGDGREWKKETQWIHRESC